jgi:hypothetical protein
MSLRMSFLSAGSRSHRHRPSTGAGALVCATLWLLGASALSGCKLFDSTCKPDDRNCLNGGLLRSGQACVRTGDCGVGLTCEKDVCAYAASTQRGDKCFVTSECSKGLYCSSDLKCKAIDDNPKTVGESCGSTSECSQGLVCDIEVNELFTQGPYGLVSDECRDKLSAQDASDECQLPKACRMRGKTELGQSCVSSDECLAGLFCGPDPTTLAHNDICIGGISLSAEPVSIPFWNGQTCPDDATTPVAYFEIPRGTSADKDFYRLPFPNDVRRRDGKVDLSTHPRPSKDLQPPAAIQFIDGAATLDGFATNPVVFFRFSQAIRSKSDLSLSSVRIVDITRSSPEYGKDADIAWGPSEVDSNYICPHWLSLHRPVGSPLRPATTYAALVTRGVHTVDGAAFARSPDFDSMLAPDRPADAKVAAAWDDYAPLRDYLNAGDSDITSDQLLNAAVFTTQDAGAIIPKLRAAVEQDGTPALSDLTVCGTGVHSPCEDDTGRGACHDDNDVFTEIHGHVALPIFQSGKIPYETAADGGDIALDGAGNPQVQGHASVCMALSIPKTAAPDGGYPLLIFAHPTGGSFSDAMGASGLSQFVAQTESPSAVLAIDLPEHGSRRGTSTRPAEDLFFNFSNPIAARGNTIQGAADLMSLTLLIQGGLSQASSPTKQAIGFDAGRVVMYGFDQGATHIALMIGFESRVRAALLSGLGGHLATSLRLRKKPVDLGSVLPFALFDPDLDNDGKLAGEEVNPMLALVQDYLESADPINYARYLQSEPASTAQDGHDVFMVYGLFDNFAPEATEAAYATAGALPAVAPDLTREFMELTAPVRANVTLAAKPRTVAVRTYDPIADSLVPNAPQDGHFVASQTKHGLADVERFLSQALDGQTPQIGP